MMKPTGSNGANGAQERLDASGLASGVARLTEIDDDLAGVVSRCGTPPLGERPPGLETLILIILEQQVSLASARAVFTRVKREIGTISTEAILRHGVEGLRLLGVTRQKAACCVDVARCAAAGTLDLTRVAQSPDVEARIELQQVKGVGPWTADVYLLMALGRPDLWPSGDLALITALQTLRQMTRRPTMNESAAMAAAWAPWRSVAARILWHGYLCGDLR